MQDKVALPRDSAPQDIFPDLYEASVADLQAGIDAGHFTSVDLVKVCVEAPLIQCIIPYPFIRHTSVVLKK